MAIAGLTLGLLGTVVSYSCFSSLDRLGKKIEKREEKREEKRTETALRLGEGVRIDDLLITFDSIRIAEAYTETKTYIDRPKPGYKFVIVEVTGENVGKRERAISGYETIEVDKGYIYDCKYGFLHFDLLPEEKGSRKLVFEILESTAPTKLHTQIGERRFIVDVTGATESTEGVNNEERPKEITQQEEKTIPQTTTSPEAQKEYMLVTPFPSKKVSEQAQIRHQKYTSNPPFQSSPSSSTIPFVNCISDDGQIVYEKQFRQGWCPAGFKEVNP